MGRRKAVISHLAALNELGITVVEIMPVAQFPGGRNWGYDGVYPFAAQNTCGGPEGLKHLLDACHRHGLAVTLDVVYNHLGAEGNYLWDYGPYFTDRYKTAWGSAVNFDGPHSDEVRGYFIENALYWLRDFHLDALRLDAVHAMLDFSAGTFLEELAGRVDEEGRRLGRRLYLIGESDLNDQRIVRTPETHGFGLHAQWADDLHHALHLQLTGEHERYYRDFVTADGSGSGEERALFWRSWAGDEQAWAVFNFGEEPAELVLPIPVGRWEKVLDSAEWLRSAEASEAGEQTEGGAEDRPEAVPAKQIASDGEVRIEVPPLTVMLFESR